MAEGDNGWLVWVGLAVAAAIGVGAVVALAVFGPGASSGAAVQSVYEDSLHNHEVITYTDRRGRRQTITVDREVR